ncbi:hypothetical protein Memar_0696 [Methanoculleus marisnigri JR1]|uniref:Uncharacterized protein n=1 Tax=Methanoculleus marisnigri (strain ATCC 35101 / DSM 1498 / JR1) TaxID=368407 RepID=A3CTC9_METMJ|nr:hypothetical protein Memar_0696 [Methanoculleus marisnigri JR1]
MSRCVCFCFLSLLAVGAHLNSCLQSRSHSRSTSLRRLFSFNNTYYNIDLI